MSAQACEEVLARLFTDPAFRESFLAGGAGTLDGYALTEAEKAGFQGMDKAGLVMASASFLHKRQSRCHPGTRKLKMPNSA